MRDAVVLIGAQMATSALNSRVQSVVEAYSIFGQLWPQFEDAEGGVRRMVGLEVELIGSHPSEASHVDPSCPMCQHVRSVLLDIADLMSEDEDHGDALFYDSHWNSIISLPESEHRSAVSVSIIVSWSRAADRAIETDLQSQIENFLERYGIDQHQRFRLQAKSPS